MSIILGIDPGTTTIGFGVVESVGRSIVSIDYGTITTTPRIPLSDKILEIARDLDDLLDRYHPTACGIERLYFTNNQKTGIDVAHARGVILLLLARRGILMHEFTPLEVKKGISGSGAAPKAQVQKALQSILRLPEIPHPDDAADALAIAYLTALRHRHS